MDWEQVYGLSCTFHDFPGGSRLIRKLSDFNAEVRRTAEEEDKTKDKKKG